MSRRPLTTAALIACEGRGTRGAASEKSLGARKMRRGETKVADAAPMQGLMLMLMLMLIPMLVKANNCCQT